MPPVHAARTGGHRQEPADRRIHRRGRTRGDRRARPLPELRRGHHVLADRRDRPVGGRHRRSRHGRGRPTQAARPARGRARRRRRREQGRERDRPVARPGAAGGGLLGDPQAVRAPRPRATARRHRRGHPLGRADAARPASNTSRSGAATRRSSCSARRVRSCSTAGRAGRSGTLGATTILLEPLGADATTRLIDELPGGLRRARRPSPTAS